MPQLRCLRAHLPGGAIEEVQKKIGTLETGRHDQVELVSGCMDTGQAMSPPVIRATIQKADENRLTIIDCPPGTSCPFVTAVKASDAVLLVTEPTPFGLHDLKLAIATLRALGKPFAVAINRSNGTPNRITDYCRSENIPVLLQIPESRRVAEAYSQGKALTTVMPELKETFAALPEKLGALS